MANSLMKAVVDLQAERVQADGSDRHSTPVSARDADWILAMAAALGTDSGYFIPIAPSAAAFQDLFDAIRAEAFKDR